MRKFLADLAKKEVQKVSLKIDNQAAISLRKNPEGMIEVQHVNTKCQLPDILTKSLDKQKLIEMRKKAEVQ